jgi:hypothetical protein
MTEALSLCTDYLFQSTKIHRVQLIIAEGNIASELDFIQLRRIAKRFSEALQQCAWNFNHVSLLLGR